jgi:hypothetical protein
MEQKQTLKGDIYQNGMLTGSLQGRQSLEGSGYPRGNDGISPTVEVTEADGGNYVVVTDIYGRHDIFIKDGKDYVITDADKAEIAEEAAKLVEIPDANAKAFVVNATENDTTVPFTYYADKTSQEIYEAWQNGEIIVCKYRMGFFRTELNPVSYSSDVIVFSNDVILPKEFTGDEELNTYVCLVIAGSQVHCFYNQLATREFVLEQIANSGEPGAGGFSPSAKVTQTTTGATITITDKDGTTHATVRNGVDGKDGDSGVYVGSGDMPEDCNVQIDPDGEALSVDWLVNAVIAKLPIYSGEVVAV